MYDRNPPGRTPCSSMRCCRRAWPIYAWCSRQRIIHVPALLAERYSFLHFGCSTLLAQQVRDATVQAHGPHYAILSSAHRRGTCRLRITIHAWDNAQAYYHFGTFVILTGTKVQITAQSTNHNRGFRCYLHFYPGQRDKPPDVYVFTVLAPLSLVERTIGPRR